MRVLLIVLVAAAAGFLWWSFRAPSTGGLSVGAMAPAFTAPTLDGRRFDLAETRGKVVVLDFWATWCPPCVAMIPHERELVKRQAGKPFVFVGISADDDLDALRSMVRGKAMDWIHIADGPGGPIQQRYGIEYYPSIFVLDAKGTIRYRDVRGKQLDKAVDALLAELGGS